MSPRVLFISNDPVGQRMSGLGIRYTELAGALRDHAEVTVAHGGTSFDPLASGAATVPFAPHDPAPLGPLIAAADVIVTHPQWPVLTRKLRRSGARVIFDLYDPETFETLELFASRRTHVRRLMGHATLDRLHDALLTGHHFMCASSAQRDLWLGAMLGLRMIDPVAYERDPALADVLAIVPFGVPPEPPVAGADGLRATLPGVAADAEVVLWNGGIWNWLDATTAIRAVARLARRRPRLRLVFMGGVAHEAARAETARAQAIAGELGLLGTVVHFHEHWVPYRERARWLTRADCAVIAQCDHLETRFAFRTRTLDCFWAGLPIVSTGGDDLSERVQREGLGATASPGDPDALALALEQVLDRGRAAYADALASTAATYAWPRVAAPLVRWVTGEAPSRRPGAAPGAVRRTPGHRARAAAYALAGRRILLRRGG